jgi:hypothetical protein
MPRGEKRKSVTKGDTRSQQGAAPSPQTPSRASLLCLPLVLQICCLKYLSPQGIAHAASTCEGMRELGTLRVCCFPGCRCRVLSAHGIATTSGPQKLAHKWAPRTWLMCSGCKAHFGCPLSLELWELCAICSEQYCMHCGPNAGDDNRDDWQCAQCEFHAQDFYDLEYWDENYVSRVLGRA